MLTTKNKDEILFKGLSGIVWIILFKCIQFLFSIIVIGFISRKIDINAFGAFVLIKIYISFFEILLDIGITSAIIQKEKLTEKNIRSAFSFLLVIGLILFLSVFVFVNYKIIDIPSSISSNMIMICAISFLIFPFLSIQMSLLDRDLDFFKKSICNLVTVILYNILLIALILLKFNVWSFVFANIASEIFHVIALRMATKWKFKLGLDKEMVVLLKKYVLCFFSFKLIFHCSSYLDKLIISRISDFSSLAFYNTSDSVLRGNMILLCSKIRSVFFPVLSRIAIENNYYKLIVKKYINTVSFFLFPVLLGCFSIANNLIIVWLGHKWIEILPYFKVFIFISGGIPLSSIIGSVFLSKGRPDLELKIGIINSIVCFLGLIISYKFGVLAIALGVAVSYSIILIFNLFMIARFLEIQFFAFISIPLKIIVLSIVMYFIIILFKQYFSCENELIIIISSMFVGMLFYLTFSKIFRLFPQEEFEWCINVIKTRVKGKKVIAL
jgi:teichuronic acid exporter